MYIFWNFRPKSLSALNSVLDIGLKLVAMKYSYTYKVLCIVLYYISGFNVSITGSGSSDKYRDFHKELKLRPYQKAVAEKSLRGENDIILLPTGTGKTYVAIQVIIEHLHKHRDGKKFIVTQVCHESRSWSRVQNQYQHFELFKLLHNSW